MFISTEPNTIAKTPTDEFIIFSARLTKYGENKTANTPNAPPNNPGNVNNDHLHYVKLMLEVLKNKKFTGTKGEFIALYDYIISVDPDSIKLFMQIFINYLYPMRVDNKFMWQTAYIHKRVDFIYLDYHKKTYEEQSLLQIKMWLAILNINVSTDVDQNKDPAADLDLNNHIYTHEERVKIRAEFKRKWEEENCPWSLNLYAFCIAQDIGAPVESNADEKTNVDNKIEACKLYKMGWEKYKNDWCLHNYANNLCDAIVLDNKKTLSEYHIEGNRLHKLNWEENKNVNSLYAYANSCADLTYEVKLKAFHLYKLGWEDYKCPACLHTYAVFLHNFVGSHGTKEKCLKLLKLNSEENNFPLSQKEYEKTQNEILMNGYRDYKNYDFIMYK